MYNVSLRFSLGRGFLQNHRQSRKCMLFCVDHETLVLWYTGRADDEGSSVFGTGGTWWWDGSNSCKECYTSTALNHGSWEFDYVRYYNCIFGSVMYIRVLFNLIMYDITIVYNDTNYWFVIVFEFVLTYLNLLWYILIS